VCYSSGGEISVSSSSSVEILPVTFITSLVSTHWRKSPKKRSRSSRTNWTIALNSSRSDSAATASCTVGCGIGVIGYLCDYLRFFMPASDMAIAIACLRLFAIGAFFGPLGLRPAWRVPALYSPMTFAILACFPALVVGFFMSSFGYFIGLSALGYFIDLLPLHFHLRRERLLGELGSDFQSPLILAERAQ